MYNLVHLVQLLFKNLGRKGESERVRQCIGLAIDRGWLNQTTQVRNESIDTLIKRETAKNGYSEFEVSHEEVRKILI